jgi:hypothetical protein
MTAGVASQGCGLLSSTKYEACYSSGAFLRSKSVAGEWGFGGQLKVFCPNKNAPELWNALAVADVKGSKWELTGEPLGAAWLGRYHWRAASRLGGEACLPVSGQRHLPRSMDLHASLAPWRISPSTVAIDPAAHCPPPPSVPPPPLADFSYTRA